MKRRHLKKTNIRTVEKAFIITGIVVLVLTVIYCFKLDTDRMQSQAAVINELEIVPDTNFGKIDTYILTDNKTGRQYIIVYTASRGILAITERVGLEEDE